MLHHNGLLGTLKKNGININLVDNIYNKNESLFIELLNNKDQNDIKKSLLEINFQNNKNNINGNGNETNVKNNTINIVKSYYDSYGKKNNNNKISIVKVNQNEKNDKTEKEKENKDVKINNDTKKKKKYANFNLNSDKLKSNKRYSLDTNRINSNNNNNNNNILNESFLNKKNKKRISMQLLSKKVYLSFEEDNKKINNDEQIQIQKKDESNTIISPPKNNNVKITKLPNYHKTKTNSSHLRLPQKLSKRSNSTNTLASNNSNTNINNNYYSQNNDTSYKTHFPAIKRYNKLICINKKIPKVKRSNSLIQPQYSNIKGGVNFKKMLSRAYLDKLRSNVEKIYSTITPNYLSVEPKCIMKVKYKNKKYNETKPAFKGLSADYTFDMNKIFFKYNNHAPPKSFEFQKMAGRGTTSETQLPSFMIGQFDRKSCITFNEKNLKMNSYSNGQLKESISSFNNKKSFNYKLNEDKKKDVLDMEAKIEFDNLVKKIIEKGIINNDNNNNEVYNEKDNNNKNIGSDESQGGINNNDINNDNFNDNRIINSIPFRIKSMYKNIMAEYKRNDNQGDKVDGITFKSFKFTIKNRKKYFSEYSKF